MQRRTRLAKESFARLAFQSGEKQAINAPRARKTISFRKLLAFLRADTSSGSNLNAPPASRSMNTIMRVNTKPSAVRPRLLVIWSVRTSSSSKFGSRWSIISFTPVLCCHTLVPLVETQCTGASPTTAWQCYLEDSETRTKSCKQLGVSLTRKRRTMQTKCNKFEASLLS